ncbi:heterokaryon incompatibility protein-domain-containing protein [Apiospora arundinis]|uniref:Heterokaryon incompatibility protein-domain-containing protein n=1 Tax=Apiospora arundinis TaxID=335852 RepID=A0ABR2JJB9_9PEZI
MVERVQHQAEQQLAVALEAAGKWLVHLCQKEGALGREFTPLEEEKFNEFFELYGHLEDFKHHHAQAVHYSLLGEDYRLVQRLLAKDDTHQVLQYDPFAIQAAIKPVPPGSHRSLKRSFGTLAPKLDLVDLVKLLVHHGAVINSQDQEWNPPLFYACRLGNAYLFKFLYESGADVSVSIRRPNPIQRRTYSEADSEADSKTGDETGNEAQHEVNLLQITLDAFMYIVHTSPVRSCFHDDPTGWDDEYDRRKEDEFYHWRLDLKATWGAIILDLVQNGLECALDDPGLIKLLHVSCYQGELDFVTVLLDFGASIDAASTSSYLKVQYGSALHAAASKWQVPVAQKLLQHGADPCILRPCRPTSFWSGWGCATPSLNSA